MSSKIKLSYVSCLLIYIHAVDIVFFCINLSGIAITRAIVMYDYFLIAILIAFGVPPLITWIYFVVIFALDLLAQVSSIYLFNVPELIKNLEFSFLYSLSEATYIIFAFMLIFVILNYLIIRQLSISKTVPSKNLVLFIVVYATLIYGLDSLNGDSYLNDRDEKIIPLTKFNIGQSSIRNAARTIVDLTHATSRPTQTINSITFKTFKADSTTNQLLIILESFGLPQQQTQWDNLKKSLVNAGASKGWNVHIGSTRFSGSTTSSELRELLNLKGDYRYLLNKDSADLFESIFQIKRKQNYHTIAAHSFSVKMFNRHVWWKNIGIDSAIFMENIISKKKLSSDHLNYSTPFTSLNDEDTFDALMEMTKPDQKVFAYLLTENSHVPFRSKVKLNRDDGMLDFKDDLSEGANNQIRRVQELLFFFIRTIDKNQWSKVLIVGDHMPPFTKESDLVFYSRYQVPFLVLSKDKISVNGGE